jgi:hypothetical protein
MKNKPKKEIEESEEIDEEEREEFIHQQRGDESLYEDSIEERGREETDHETKKFKRKSEGD